MCPLSLFLSRTHLAGITLPLVTITFISLTVLPFGSYFKSSRQHQHCDVCLCALHGTVTSSAPYRGRTTNLNVNASTSPFLAIRNFLCISRFLHLPSPLTEASSNRFISLHLFYMQYNWGFLSKALVVATVMLHIRRPVIVFCHPILCVWYFTEKHRSSIYHNVFIICILYILKRYLEPQFNSRKSMASQNVW